MKDPGIFICFNQSSRQANWPKVAALNKPQVMNTQAAGHRFISILGSCVVFVWPLSQFDDGRIGSLCKRLWIHFVCTRRLVIFQVSFPLWFLSLTLWLSICLCLMWFPLECIAEVMRTEDCCVPQMSTDFLRSYLCPVILSRCRNLSPEAQEAIRTKQWQPIYRWVSVWGDSPNTLFLEILASVNFSCLGPKNIWSVEMFCFRSSMEAPRRWCFSCMLCQAL